MSMSPGIGLKLLQAPTWEPVEPGDMTGHSRIANADLDNGVVEGFILAARDYVETQTRRKIASQQWLLTMDQFPGRQVDDYRPPTWRYGIIRLPFSPLISVDSVKYVDPGYSGGQPFPLTTVDASMYQVKATTEPGQLAPNLFNVWPATNPLAFEAVQVTFTVGYADAATVKAQMPGLILAIKLLTAHFYEHREASTEESIKVIPLGLAALIAANSIQEYD